MSFGEIRRMAQEMKEEYGADPGHPATYHDVAQAFAALETVLWEFEARLNAMAREVSHATDPRRFGGWDDGR